MANVENEEKRVRRLNRWMIILVSFMVLYSILMLVIIDQKTERAMQLQSHPVVMIDPNTMSITSTAYTNLIHPVALHNTTNIPPVPITNSAKPMYEQRDKYEIGDFVVINYFYVEGIIIEKLSGDVYKILYKDHNHTLQKIELHKQFLLYPTSYNVVNPVSLLVD